MTKRGAASGREGGARTRKSPDAEEPRGGEGPGWKSSSLGPIPLPRHDRRADPGRQASWGGWSMGSRRLSGAASDRALRSVTRTARAGVAYGVNPQGTDALN